MRAVLGSLCLVIFLAYPVVGGINYNLPTHGYSANTRPVYDVQPEVYSLSTNGHLNTQNSYLAGGSLGYENGFANGGFANGGFANGGFVNGGFANGGFANGGFATGEFDGGFGNVGGFEAYQQPAIVSKFFSLHSAPEEPREVQIRHLTIGEPRKNYRVVFIKAPVQHPPVARITASFAPKEEKTVIYVLSKKPEVEVINEIVQPAPTEPSKPEVVFIKYKTPEEAAHAQQEIQAQYDVLGGSSQVSNEGVAPITSVIGSLGHAGHLLEAHPTSDSLFHILSTRSPKVVSTTLKRKH